ncbi:uncharacterized protein [Haliotis asinina]|uniref:uncharacterized protein n=1 Tax=Haliotis asinina TaxID=109174 RepID=UPI00353180B9
MLQYTIRWPKCVKVTNEMAAFRCATLALVFVSIYAQGPTGPTAAPTSGPPTGAIGGSMGAPTGSPTGPVGGPMNGPVGGPVGGPMSGPVGMGGPMSGPMGGPMGGPMSGPMGGSMGGPMSGPMGMGGPMSGMVPPYGAMGGSYGNMNPYGGYGGPRGGFGMGQYGKRRNQRQQQGFGNPMSFIPFMGSDAGRNMYFLSQMMGRQGGNGILPYLFLNGGLGDNMMNMLLFSGMGGMGGGRGGQGMMSGMNPLMALALGGGEINNALPYFFMNQGQGSQGRGVQGGQRQQGGVNSALPFWLLGGNL